MNRFVLVTLALGCVAGARGALADASFEENSPGACGASSGAALQVLGSGGPMHGGARGSAAYLLWFKGHPSILVDIGGGTTAALARAGVHATQIDALLISHLHLTCSILPEEKHRQIARFLAREPAARAVPLRHPALAQARADEHGGVQVLPGDARDGFYYAALARGA